MEDVTEKTDYELHMSMRNISLKVAVGYALPNQPRASYHLGDIPAGYARVGVDEIVPGFETMDLEIPGGDEEKTLGDVKRGFVLWNKKYIVFLGSLPRPPTPPCSSPPQKQCPSLPERDPSASPSRSPPQQQSPPPPREEAPVKWLPTKRHNGTPVKKKARKEKTPPPLEKRPWEMSTEENNAVIKAYNIAFFAPKKPEPPREKLPAEVVERTVAALWNPPPKPHSDHERSIDKSYSNKSEEPKKGKQVPQLGEQDAQSVPPLKVFDDKATQGSQQHIGSTTDYPVSELAYKYVAGENLAEQVKCLTTKMCHLHTWYKKAAKKGIISIMVAVKEEHYFQEYAVSVEFSELFQLYNLRSLEKSIISCYIL